jgi:hypothetical protein
MHGVASVKSFAKAKAALLSEPVLLAPDFDE